MNRSVTRRLTAAALTGAVLLTGCSTTEDPPPTDPESVYTTVVRGMVDDIELVPDETLLAIGRNICSAYDLGATSPEILAIALESGITAEDAGALSGAATAAFCPEYEGGVW